MTGHGVFGKFLHRIGKAETSSCWYFSEIEYHSEHTLFGCPRWDETRLDVGRKLESHNKLRKYGKFDDKRPWDAIREFIHRIISQKIEDERTNSTE